MEWTIRAGPLALSEEVTRLRPSLKKALDVIDYFPQKVKLQFDDIFVSTREALYFNLNSLTRKFSLR